MDDIVRLEEENTALRAKLAEAEKALKDAIPLDQMDAAAFQINFLEAKLEEVEGILLLAEKIIDGVGVHPAEWHDPHNPENSYTERTPEMNEHNKRITDFYEALARYRKAVEG